MNYKRKHPRATPTHGARHSGEHWMANWPRWYDVVFHTRPARRRAAAVMRRLWHGADPDDVTFDAGNHKPHRYYW